MTYQVLARKWRPRQFSELVGQEHVVRALVNGLDNDRLHHAFLFTGTRGVGKTTIARILAKALNCERGVSSTPCGECATCTDVDEGRFVDLIEVDAASRTKAEDTRELLENVQYAPSRGRYKVYLIDEVHMLSGHSFAALLKTLEEPPPHVKFLLATTDPQKLPVTILSRCLQFNLKRLPADMISAYLVTLLENEGVPGDEEGLALIARAADGSMRDALSLLDQAISYCGGHIKAEEVGAMIGTVERGRLVALVDALVAGDADALWHEIDELEQFTPDFSKLLGEVAELFHRVAMTQFVARACQDGPDPESINRLADQLSPGDVQLYYQIAVHGRRDVNLAPDPRSGFEMTLLRMLAFRPDSRPTPESGGSGGQAREAGTRPKAAAPPADNQASARAPTPTSKPVSAPATKEEVEYRPSEPPAEAPGLVADQDPDDWAGLIDRLALKGTAAVLASNSQFERIGSGHFRIRVCKQNEHLHTPAAEDKLRQALARFFGKDVRVQFEFGEVSAETPAQKHTRETDETLQAAIRSIDEDPVVKNLQSTFGAEVIPGSVRPSDS
jgi:DNA polymerase-3 subunit gamma/tau